MQVLENNFKLNFNNNSFNFYNASEGIFPFVVSEILDNSKTIIIVLRDNKYIIPFENSLKAITGLKNILIFPAPNLSSELMHDARRYSWKCAEIFSPVDFSFHYAKHPRTFPASINIQESIDDA